MIDQIDLSMVDWARAQFALTAIYHWLFVPLTLGLSFIVAIMETIYVRTGNPEWKKITKFWMILFGINFAIGVATGIKSPSLNSSLEQTGLITPGLSGISSVPRWPLKE